MSPNNAEAIVLGVVALHNFLRREVGLHYIGPKSTDYKTSRGDWQPGQWRAEGVGNMLRPMQRHGKPSIAHHKCGFSVASNCINKSFRV